MQHSEQNGYDTIVVGSGPGGGTIAQELSRQGQKVLILERGTSAPINGTVLQCIQMGLVPGRSLLFTEQMLGMNRGITYGGSSVLAYACAIDPTYEMFDSYGVDLRQDVEQIKNELPISPLADELVGPAANHIMSSAQSLGYNWQKIPKIVYQEHCRANCDKCAVGCPHGAKWTARVPVEIARQNEAVLISDAFVKKVIVNGNRAEGVEFSYQGQEKRAYAPTTIISAGGIGTPMILRNSGISRAGYDFFFDPLIVVSGTLNEMSGGKEFPMAAGLVDKEQGYVMTDLVWPKWLYWLFTAEVLRIDRLHTHQHCLPIMVKIKDQLGGSLTKRGGLRKKLTTADKQKLQHGYGRAREILENAGARSIFKTWYVAAHPGGTAKIGDIVDENLKTEYDNLYVCDASVIPEAYGLPPTLTILALAKRLARHLLGDARL